MSQIDSTREHLIETYRKKAKHYDFTSQFYPAPGYPQRAHRLRAVQAPGLRPGDSVVDIAQSQAMAKALQKAGKPVQFVVLDGEDHWLSGEATRTAMLKAMVDFVEKYNPPDSGPAS